MEYSELKEQTWIYFDNKYHFVQELNDGFVLLAYSPIEYISIPKTMFPTHAKIVEPNKYVVNETVLYIGEHETAHNKKTQIIYVGEYEKFKNKFGIIKTIDPNDARLTYGILFDKEVGFDDELWVSAFDILPIDY